MSLLEKVEHNLAAHSLWERGECLLLGISGGVDSMVLLNVLRQLAPAHRWKLSIAHFNHQLRDAADADEAFVREAAQAFELPFYAGRGDVRTIARERGLSIEMAARELRHGFLAATARAHQCGRIVLAHHADDQVETFWLRLLRGDLGPGLAAMRWARPSSQHPEITLVRPLLNISKAELMAWAAEQKVSFRDDLSNFAPDVERNRLRIELLPMLEQFQPRLRALTLRAVEVLSAEKSFVAEAARDWLAAPDRSFGELHLALQREIIRLQMIQHQLRPTAERIEFLRTHPATNLSVAESVLVRCDGGIVQRVDPKAVFAESESRIFLEDHGTASFGRWCFHWRIVPERGAQEPLTEYFDAGALGEEITLRHWRAGDRFQPIGLRSAAKLQDLFTNQKVPADEKRGRVVALDQAGRIFWAEGLRISELHKVTGASRTILQWRWQNAAD